ncbi:DUF6191 domain-containing protein [Streptomyces sp. e14]|uniref:DUF6191 domain-containing protein n=1 Tax=unclassified Streptomyces TaxID=2593676 RepID=UPI0001D05C68|nr:DUF6191 domain-containing protein [Streptomyces sp. e14]EFF93225.1 conserved hypothetical protein [Streptomyces sp. e14]MYX41198.1 hypothetical protein [Streptomyces sp. SID89]
MFNAFEELFAPGRKHTTDEQNRLELTREDVGDGDPGRGPVDLASGKVVVRLPRTAPETADPDGDTASDRGAASDGETEPGGGAAPDGETAPDGDTASDRKAASDGKAESGGE